MLIRRRIIRIAALAMGTAALVAPLFAGTTGASAGYVSHTSHSRIYGD